MLSRGVFCNSIIIISCIYIYMDTVMFKHMWLMFCEQRLGVGVSVGLAAGCKCQIILNLNHIFAFTSCVT